MVANEIVHVYVVGGEEIRPLDFKVSSRFACGDHEASLLECLANGMPKVSICTGGCDMTRLYREAVVNVLGIRHYLSMPTKVGGNKVER